MILYEVLNERPDVLAERTYSVWPDLEALMREHHLPQFTVDGHRPVGAFDLFGVSFSTELGYTNLLTALDLAGIPHRAADRTDGPPDRDRRRARGVQPRADRRLHRRRRARRRRAGRPRHHRSGAQWKADGRPEGRDGLLLRARRRVRSSTCRASTTSTTCPTGGSGGVAPNRSGRAVPGAQAHRHGPRRVAVPEAAAGPAGRDRARADERRDLPGLHARLPVLPGRDDHPPGPRAQHHRHRRDGRARAAGHRFRGGRPAVAVAAPTTPRSATWPRVSPTATRAPTPACRCRPPASTPSTSTWPTSSPATAAAPG